MALSILYGDNGMAVPPFTVFRGLHPGKGTTTDYGAARDFQSEFPHTAKALSYLVTAMADAKNNRGKKSFFGRDKGLASLQKFEKRLGDTLLALARDDVIDGNASPKDVALVLEDAIRTWECIYPNWQDAYSFADEYFDECHKADTHMKSGHG
jgi:hypothetical protein